jgi:hypothetical protein
VWRPRTSACHWRWSTLINLGGLIAPMSDPRSRVTTQPDARELLHHHLVTKVCENPNVEGSNGRLSVLLQGT